MSPDKMKLALGVSLVLNLFLIAAGIGAGVVVHHRMHDFRKPPSTNKAWGDTARDLTPEARARILAVVKTAALGGEADMEQARALRLQAAALAGKDPYDVNQVAALSAQARVLEGDARNKVEDALIRGIAPLAANERTAVANRMLRASFRFRRMTGKDDHGPEGPKPDGPKDQPH